MYHKKLNTKMPTSCEIDFENNPMKIVFAGELLCGSVRLTLTKEKKLRAVYIQIKGRASVRIDDPTRGYNSGRQNYLNKAIYLVRQNDGEIQLKPGIYNYTFQCMMPFDLPSSVEGSIGYIRYTACVVVDVPMWRNKEFELQFTVIRPIDLNAYPSLREPVIVTKNKSFFLNGLLCTISSQRLNIVARIPVQGYTPRQIIPLEIHVNNNSNRSIREFKVQLIKGIFYLRRRREFFTIIEKYARGCDANQKQRISMNLSIPPIFPTDLPTISTKIIEVKHLIRITGLMVGCCKNPVLNLPIAIGSYPFQEDITAYPIYEYYNSNMRTHISSSFHISCSSSDLTNQSVYSMFSYQNAAYRPFESDFNDDPPAYGEIMHMDNAE